MRYTLSPAERGSAKDATSTTNGAANMPAPSAPGPWRGSGSGWVAAHKDATPVETLHAATSAATTSHTPCPRRARNNPYEAANAATPVSAAPALRMTGRVDRSDPRMLAVCVQKLKPGKNGAANACAPKYRNGTATPASRESRYVAANTSGDPKWQMIHTARRTPKTFPSGSKPRKKLSMEPAHAG